MKKQRQQLGNALTVNDIPICRHCKKSEQMLRCDVSRYERQACSFIMCRECYESMGEQKCEISDPCRSIKEHKATKTFADKVKNQINTKFRHQNTIRRQFRDLKKYAEIDEDMTHILGALIAENEKLYNATYKKQVDKLVADLQQMKSTIESHSERGNLPIFKKQILNENENIDKGKLACGYNDTIFNKGLDQILKAFY